MTGAVARQPHVAVVGGGISGLVAAYRLRRLLGDAAGITVLDKATVSGGVLRTISLGGRPYDVGAEAFLARRPEVLALADELGLAGEVVHPSDARARIRAGGISLPLPARTFMGVPPDSDAVLGVLPDAALRRVDAERALPPVRLGGADVTVGALLRERFGPEVPDRLVDTLLGGVYAGRADSLGLRATMPALAAALDAGAGSVSEAVAGLLPRTAPVTAVCGPVFGALRGGWVTLTDRLRDAAGAQLRLGVPVRSLHRDGDGWQLGLAPAPSPEFLPADAVLLAVPAPAARRLLGDVAPPAAKALALVELASMVIVAMALPADVALPDASGVLVASGERRADGTPFTAKGFTFSSRKWPHLGGGEVLVRGSAGRHGEVESLRVPDAELAAAVRADLAELTGVTAEPVRTVVTRWGGGLPQYGVGHVELVDTVEHAVAKVPRLAIAGSVLHGVGVPACVATADAAAGRLAEQLGRI
jgi:protoporphyrinogen/coproporphyrinogen III oxidase